MFYALSVGHCIKTKNPKIYIIFNVLIKYRYDSL